MSENRSVKNMPTAVSLNEYWIDYLNELVASGDYASFSEVIREALRLQRDRRNAKKLTHLI